MLIIKTYEEKQEEIRLQEIDTQVAEAKQYLVDTDHKFYGDYEPKIGEDLELVRTKRRKARAFVGANKEKNELLNSIKSYSTLHTSRSR